MPFSRIITFCFALLLSLLSAGRVSACSCLGESTPCEEFGSARAVFVGKVMGAKEQREAEGQDGVKTKYDVGEIYFKVEETFLGAKTERIVIHSGTGGGDCGYWFRRGERYLVYAYGDSPDGLHTNICTRTREQATAEEDLVFLRSLPRQGTGARIYGSVEATLSDTTSEAWRKTKPLGGVTVKIEGRRRTYDAVTDAEGNYELTGLEAGEYKVYAVLPDYYYSDSYSIRKVKVNDRGCAQESFFAHNDSLIAGQVTDTAAHGRSNMRVALIPVESPEPVNWARTDMDYTDEQGRFELKQIPAGRYLLGINVGTSPDNDAPYPTTFYPGVTNRARATVIEVGLGQKLKGMNIQLPPKLVEFTVAGVVVWPDGRPAVKAQVHLEDVNYPDWCVNGCGMETDAQGRFTLRGYASYTYFVKASKLLQDKGQRMNAEAQTITLGGDVLGIRLILSLSDMEEFKESKSP